MSTIIELNNKIKIKFQQSVKSNIYCFNCLEESWDNQSLIFELSSQEFLIQKNHCSQLFTFSTAQDSIIHQQPILKTKQKTKIPKETNPNLLKNLVVTLRSWVAIKPQFANEIEVRIWKFFKSAKKVNKHMMWLVYGDIREEESSYQIFIQEIEQLKGISIDQYRKVQQSIRDYTLSQLKQANIEFILKYRRVKNREQFRKYFYSFVQKLQRGQPFSGKRANSQAETRSNGAKI